MEERQNPNQAAPSAEPEPENSTSGNTAAEQQADRTDEVNPDAVHESSSGVPPKAKGTNELMEWIKALAIAGVLVVLIRWFLVSPFIVDGPSMKPNFHDRDRIIVNKIIYDIRTPKRGEVIVFHVPEEGRDFIKRVIAVPGDTVKVEGDTVTINGEAVVEHYLQAEIDKAEASGIPYNKSEGFPNMRFPDGTVPDGTLFVMGDNRSNSEDSRAIGYIPLERVVGRADLVYWPLDQIKLVKH